MAKLSETSAEMRNGGRIRKSRVHLSAAQNYADRSAATARRLGVRSGEVVVDGEARRPDARRDVELAVDGPEVLADGALADTEALADFGVRQSTGNERKNFHL